MYLFAPMLLGCFELSTPETGRGYKLFFGVN